jgi:hypothetical protein
VCVNYADFGCLHFQAHIEQWIDFASLEIDANIGNWLRPRMGRAVYLPPVCNYILMSLDFILLDVTSD